MKLLCQTITKMEVLHVRIIQKLRLINKAGKYDGFSSKDADMILRMNNSGKVKTEETETKEEISQPIEDMENKENFTPDVRGKNSIRRNNHCRVNIY